MFDDVDIGDTHSASITGVNLTGNSNGITNATFESFLGLATTSANGAGSPGAVDWSFSADDGLFAYLGEGQTLEIAYDITVDDGNGGTDTDTVTVTINGTNEAPVITPIDTAVSLSNGSFETALNGLTDWSVTFGDLDRVGTSVWDPSDGSFSLDLNGFNPAGISQSIATEAGTTYTVTFDMAGNPGQQTVKEMRVSADGTSQDYSFDNAAGGGTSGTNMNWTQNSFTFVADDDEALLDFSSLVPSGAWGPTLDNVEITRDGYIVQEDGTLAVSGDFDATDVDSGAVLSWSVDGGGTGTYGDLSIDANGTWTYNLRNGDANVQALAQGESQDEVFTVVVTDEHGATDTATVTLTVCLLYTSDAADE